MARQVGKGKFRTRLNWGFWVLVVGFVIFAVTWFILIPRGYLG
jgi:hypothetical protein